MHPRPDRDETTSSCRHRRTGWRAPGALAAAALLALSIAASTAASPEPPRDTAPAATDGPTATDEPAAERGATLLFVLDTSAAMARPLGEAPAVDVVRRVLAEVVGGLPAAARVGVVALGHDVKSRGGAIEDAVPLGPPRVGLLERALGELSPAGPSAVSRGLGRALVLVGTEGRPATLVLLTAGDPGGVCSVIGAAPDGASLVLHAIRLDVDLGQDAPGAGEGPGEVAAGRATAELRCAAEAGDGHYAEVRDTDALAAALGEALAAGPAVPTGGLSVRVVANGELIDAAVHVEGVGGRRAIARTYAEPSTNPRFLPLEPGRYSVTVSPLTLRDARRESLDFTVGDGQIAEREVDFSSATLSVAVRHNGAAGAALVRVRNAGGKQVAGGRLRSDGRSQPKIFSLRPGRYEVSVQARDIVGEPRAEFTVEVTPAKPAEVTHAFASGTLEIAARADGGPAQALVTVHPRGEPRELARLYARARPATFRLEPGAYDVRVRAAGTRGGRGAVKVIAVEIEAGGAISKVVELAANGS